MSGNSTEHLGDDLALARRLADAADAVSLPRFGASDLKVDSKPDLTPVSDADLAVERALRQILDLERPQDSVLGEEYGDSNPEAPRRWVIDPIDGTKNFVRGVPVWATLIALQDVASGESVVGVVSAPALGRRWWAARGSGAFVSFAGTERRLGVSAVSVLADASLAYSDRGEWAAAGRAGQFEQVLDQCWRTRGYGDFWSYMLLAEGAVDIAGEPELSLWDVAALIPIVLEAGGQISEADGTAAGHPTGSALATNGLLHDQVVRILTGQ